MKDTIIIGGNCYSPSEDGITHVNVYSQGSTLLGRMLSNFERTPVCTCHGDFESLEGYYHYLKGIRSLKGWGAPTIKMQGILDKLHVVWGHDAKRMGNELRNELRVNKVRVQDVPDEWFHEMFKKAVLQKIKTNDELTAMVSDNTLPYVHYYVYNRKATHKPHFDWLPNLITEVIMENNL